MSHQATVLEIKHVHHGQWPDWRHRYYFTWWIGPLSRFVGFQIWRFRVNLYYDNWGKRKWDADNVVSAADGSLSDSHRSES